MSLEDMALALLKDADADIVADAKAATVGNSTLGGVLSLQTGAPRWMTERAVVAALNRYREK